MTEKELRKLGRAELLELLLEQAREASLKINSEYEAAQKAAEQYQQIVERLCQEKISAAESQAQEILARAKKAANQQ